MNEYILFTKSELINLEKTFLITQISILNSLKNLKEYKTTRGLEFASKIKIKTLVEEAQNELQILDKLLPQTSFKSEEEKEIQELIPTQFKIESEKKNSLEEELERIRKRLSLLQ